MEVPNTTRHIVCVEDGRSAYGWITCDNLPEDEKPLYPGWDTSYRWYFCLAHFKEAKKIVELSLSPKGYGAAREYGVHFFVMNGEELKINDPNKNQGELRGAEG